LALRDLQSTLAVVDQEKHCEQLHEWLEELLHKVRSLIFVPQGRLAKVA
jgi:hypothetical protein